MLYKSRIRTANITFFLLLRSCNRFLMMKYILHIIFCLFLISGCVSQNEDISISVSPNVIECPEEGGTFDLNISGTKDWKTDTYPEWITVANANGNASVTIAGNDSFSRQHELIFRHGSKTASVDIYQHNSKVFRSDKSELQTDYRGGKFSFEIECYSDWKLDGLADWIDADILEGDQPEAITLTVGKNLSKTERQHTLLLISGDERIEINIHQGPGPYIALEKDSIDIDGNGGFAEVLFLSNTDIDIASDSYWIRLLNVGHDVRKVTFEVLRNTSDARKGHITISSSSDSEYFMVLTVNQGEKIPQPKISFEESSNLLISDNTGFVLHPIFTDMTNTSLTWVSDKPEVASVNNLGEVSIHKCGKCTITAKNGFHGVSASINVTVKIKAESIGLKLDEQDLSTDPIAVRFAGESLKIIILPDPGNAYTEDFVCISSDPSVAEINGYNIKCIKGGSVYISVESQYNNINKHFQLFILEQ